MVYRLVIDPEQITQNWVTLALTQRHYLQRVLRLRTGDRLLVMDGRGRVWLAQLEQDQVQLLQPLQESSELTVSVNLLVALPKAQGFDELIRPCTELGVQTLQPIFSERTLLKPSLLKLNRWQRIATEAAEQSERQLVPQVCPPIPLDQALVDLKNATYPRYLCVTRRDCPSLMASLPSSPPDQIVIATGPEGGWTEKEIKQAIAVGFEPVSLGRRILRAITAPTVAMAQVSAYIEANSPQSHAKSHQ